MLSAISPRWPRPRAAYQTLRTWLAGCCIHALPVLAACAAAQAGGNSATSPTRRDGRDPAAVEAVVADSFFAAVTRMDEAAMRRSATPAFDLQSDSTRLDLDGYVARVRRIAERGGRIEYAISEPRTRIRGDVAWTTYRSRGHFFAADDSSRWLEWIETAVLVRDAGGRWRIDRLHSATVARSP